MERHLFLTGKTELHGSLVALNSMQAKLHENQSTGLIEVKVGASRQIVLSYANGALTGVFLLDQGGQSRPFNLAELSTLWGGAPFSVCSVNLPDRAGRSIWLILESRKQEQFEVRGEEAWSERLKLWEQEKFSGAIEVTSKTGQGFAVLQKGKLLAEESVFFNGQEFENALPPGIGLYGNWQATTYAAAPSSRARERSLLGRRRFGTIREHCRAEVLASDKQGNWDADPTLAMENFRKRGNRH
jgi:hypothetical protein